MSIPHPELQAQLKAAAQAVAPDLELTFRAMFGGAGVYAYGQMFASLSGVGLALKLSAETQTEFLKVEGAKRLQYDPSMPPSKQYILVPSSYLSKPKTLGKWVKASLEYVSTLPEKKRSALPQKSSALAQKKRSALPQKEPKKKRR